MIAGGMVAPLDRRELCLLLEFARDGLFCRLALFDVARKEFIVLLARVSGEQDLIFLAVDDRHGHGDGEIGELERAASFAVGDEPLVF